MKLLFSLCLLLALSVAFACDECCWWDPGQDPSDPKWWEHGAVSGNYPPQLKQCYRKLNQSAFVKEDWFVEAPWDPTSDVACDGVLAQARSLGIDHSYYMSYIASVTAATPGAHYGAMIVNMSSPPQIMAIGINNGTKHLTYGHAEIRTLINFTSLYPSVMKPFSNYILYTTGESCPMCASALAYSGFPLIVYGTSIPELIVQGWSQINIRHAEIIRAQVRLSFVQCLLGGVRTDLTNPLTSPYPFPPVQNPPPDATCQNECDDDCGHGHRHGGHGGGNGHGHGRHTRTTAPAATPPPPPPAATPPPPPPPGHSHGGNK